MGPERNRSAAGQMTIDLDESDSRPERETESNLPTVLQALDETAELFAPARMAQLPESLGFNLSDAFAGDLEVLADLFQRVISRLTDAETFAQHLFFPRRQCLEGAVDLSL